MNNFKLLLPLFVISVLLSACMDSRAEDTSYDLASKLTAPTSGSNNCSGEVVFTSWDDGNNAVKVRRVPMSCLNPGEGGYAYITSQGGIAIH